MHLVREAFFAMSQKIEGIIYLTCSRSEQSCSADHYQTLKNLTSGVTNPYGDFLMSLDKAIQGGHLLLGQAESLSARSQLNPNSCEGLWVACMRAGYPAQFHH